MELEAISVETSLNANIYCDKLEEITDLEIFLIGSAGHWKRCGGPHVARGPLFSHPCLIRRMGQRKEFLL